VLARTEDARIEHSTHTCAKSRAVVCEDRSLTEKFTVSVKDGIDIRETMRTGSPDIYVGKPPFAGENRHGGDHLRRGHDEKYPHYATWYAEHEQESTSPSTHRPSTDMIGPESLVRITGTVLLFPRHGANVFALENIPELKSLAEYLAYGGLLFHGKNHSYVAAKKPGVRLVRWQKNSKTLCMDTAVRFSMETIRRLRTFHCSTERR